MDSKNDNYHLGTSDEELDRLGFQHQAWQEFTLKLWTRAGFDYGQTLLDLGCGPGFATLELARLVGGPGRVHAVDAAEKFVRYLEACLAAGGVRNVVASTGDVHSIGLGDAAVDGVFARWLLCFVSDPQTVCNEVARVLRPWGTFVAWDYYNYSAVRVFPERPSIQKLFASYYRSSINHGGTYDVAQHLPRMMQDSGLEVVHFEPINRAVRPGSLTWRWVSLFNSSYLPNLVAQGLMSQEETDQFRRDWSELESDPATLFFTPPMLGIIARKPA